MKPAVPLAAGQGIMNLAACGGTFSTGLTRLTRFFYIFLYPEHPVYPV
jgi:hypothetical protein